MIFSDPSRVEIRLGKYGLAPATALVDPTPWQKAQEYRRLGSSRLVPVAGDEIERKIPNGEMFVTRKLDGEFTVLVIEGDDVYTVNPGGTVRVGLPFFEEAKKRFRAAGIDRAIVAGELHVAYDRGSPRTRIHDVVRAAQRPPDDATLGTLRFAPFDFIEPTLPDATALHARLDEVTTGSTFLAQPEVRRAKTFGDVKRIFDEWVVAEGGEGLVIRSDRAGLFKVKPRHTLDLVVLGFAEGIDDRRGMVHDILLGVVRPGGAYHIVGRVGGGISDDDRRALYSDLRDMVVKSEYSEVSSDHVAYQMVRPEWVVEISCLDLVSSTTRGASIDRMVLTFDGAASQWLVARRMPLVSIIGPSYIGRRPDKSPTERDAGINQITRVVDLPDAERDATRESLPRSTIMKREVYTKTMKGQQMVRKLVAWKTNKDANPDYPAYVLALTDFSPNRRTPLERDLRVSSSEAQILALYDELAAEYFGNGKGWTKP